MSSGRVRARDIVTAAGIVSRRGLRRRSRTPVVRLSDDRRFGLTEQVPLGPGWERFSFGRVVFAARITAPPVILLHKPAGVVTSRVADGGHATFAWLLGEPVASQVEPIGRLDVDVTGVLLLAADGALIHALTHPRRGIERRYRAWPECAPDESGLAELRSGRLALRDGHVPTVGLVEPAAEPGAWELVLAEGRYHEVKRIFAALGAPLRRLERVSYAGIDLSAGGAAPLEAGRWRRLDEPIVASVYKGARLTPGVWIDTVDSTALPVPDADPRGAADSRSDGDSAPGKAASSDDDE